MKPFILFLLCCCAATAHAQEAAQKSKVVPMIAIPAELGTARDYQEELVEAYARSILVYNGISGLDIMRKGAWVGGIFFEFVDRRTALTIKIFLNDTFLVGFADGTTLEMKFIGIYAPSGLMFQVVPGTERTALGEPLVAVPIIIPYYVMRPTWGIWWGGWGGGWGWGGTYARVYPAW